MFGPPEGYVPSPAEVEMATTWTPSHEQDEAVARYFVETGETEAYTAHILVGKQYGFWELGAIKVEPVAGVYRTREEAHAATLAASEAKHAATGVAVTGGYAWHRRPAGEEPILSGTPEQPSEWMTKWAVWEDILAVYPTPSWRRTAATG